MTAAGRILHIFIAPARGAPMLALPEAEVIAECGLAGDRYADATNRRSPDYQLSLIEIENVEAFAQASGLALKPDDPRRNLVTKGIRLNDLCGKRFMVGAVELEGLELCEPCATFAQRTHPEVVRFFVHRGGLRCRILSGGRIRIGDEIGGSVHV
jgi:MOSC domain-containing protein YiiM